MNGRRAGTVAGLVLVVLACGAPRGPVRVERIPLYAGETRIDVLRYEADAPGPAYLNVHDDEDTSVEAALAVIARRGGRVLTLAHTGARNITFVVDGRRYTADPNRIFTDAGADATLQRLGGHAPAARAAARAFGEALLRLLQPEALPAVVTLHNNTEAGYSAESYAPGGDAAAEARLLHVAPGTDPDDFFFVTDEGLFDRLRIAGFNVILQDNARATDDGSLSVRAARAGLPYVNAEAQHGHRDVQEQMLEQLHSALTERAAR
jgi:hypothetical protein